MRKRDKLVFYHDGKPFDAGDVKGVSSMLMETKDKNDASTIGKFDMGFKSAFKYTYQPEVYSDEEAFQIENYLLPVEMPGAWDYQTEKQKLSYEVTEGGRVTPFVSSEHLPKFVIPFAKKKDDGSLVSVPGNEVLTKLEGLTGEILLFLTHIKLTIEGEMVHPKSEVIIANCLHYNEVGYEYELVLELEPGKMLRPDFKVVDGDTGDVWYWEHCGMMTDPG